MSEHNFLISIIIPTRGNRPALLKRAVDSALSGHKPGEVEVIVIPNGPTRQWQHATNDLGMMPGVRVQPINDANVCAARNHGLSIANGELVRFLDDDDFLVPEIALRQYRQLLDSDADVSSYAVRIEDEFAHIHSTLLQPDTPDFVSGQLGPSRLQIPLAHVYRKSFIENLRWNEKYSVSEDILWLHTVASKCQVRWLKSPDIVGVWYQHKGSRLSYNYAAHKPYKITAESIIDTFENLSRQICINDIRRNAAAAGLWSCIHTAFYLHPLYWHSVARYALALDPDSHPDIDLYRLQKRHRPNPLLMEWLVLPKRFLNNFVRNLRSRFIGRDHVRQL